MNGRQKTLNIYKIGLLVVITSLVLALMSAMQVNRAAAGPDLQATRTRTPTRRVPTITPTRTLKPPNLDNQVAFAGVGGNPENCLLPTDLPLPAIEYISPNLIATGDIICLYGFPDREKVTVKILDPNNKLVAAIPLVIQNVPIEGFDQFVSSISMNTLSARAPAGRWTVIVDRPGSKVTRFFNRPPTYTGFTLSKAVDPGTPWYDSRRTENLMVGETLLVEGVNYPPNQEFPVAIYRGGNPPKLVVAQTVRTNRQGALSAGFAITNQFTPGWYIVNVIPDLSYQDVMGFNTSYFQVIQPASVCPGGQPSRLQKNDVTIVSAGPPNNVREKPGLSNKVVDKLYEYESLEYLAGPKCVDGLVWWKVSSNNTGVDGWTAEGQKTDYWINSIGP